MKKLLFGSKAIKYHWEDYYKPANDIDYICKEKQSTKGIEYHWCDSMQYIFDNNINEEVVDKNFLFTIKVSHLPWDLKNNKWWKHLKDVVFMQNKGCELDNHLLNLLHREWSKLHGSKDHINLNQNTDYFFNKNIEREYNHDFLHNYFKIGDVPAYQKILKYNDKATVCQNKFNCLTEYEKLCTIIEEMMVIAFERKIHLVEAYKVIITRLSKGWWNTFCILNAVKILDGFVEEKKIYKQKVNNLLMKE